MIQKDLDTSNDNAEFNDNVVDDDSLCKDYADT